MDYFCGILSFIYMIQASLKKIALAASASCLLLFNYPLYAQRGAIEIGLGAGGAVNGNPRDNMYYKGDKMAINYAALFNTTYNFHRNVAVGFEVRAAELARKAPNAYTTYMHTVIGGDNKRFVYSKSALSACLVANGKYVTPMGYIYGGGAMGYGISRHDSKVLSGNEGYRAPDGGRGIVYGFQAGYTHGLNAVLGVNAEAAVRIYNMNYDAGAPEIRPYTNLNYNIASYSICIALKARILPKYSAQNDIPAMRGRGRSARPMKPRRR